MYEDLRGGRLRADVRIHKHYKLRIISILVRIHKHHRLRIISILTVGFNKGTGKPIWPLSRTVGQLSVDRVGEAVAHPLSGEKENTKLFFLSLLEQLEHTAHCQALGAHRHPGDNTSVTGRMCDRILSRVRGVTQDLATTQPVVALSRFILIMASQVIEYSADDTAEGFLRWRRWKEPTSLPYLHKLLMSVRRRRTWKRDVRWIPILVILLIFITIYISTLVNLLYDITPVFLVSFKTLTVDSPVWCGMTVLDSDSFHCFNGTIDVRIYNKLWLDVDILECSLDWTNPLETGGGSYGGRLSYSDVSVPSRSDKTYTLKMVTNVAEVPVRFHPTIGVFGVRFILRVLGCDFDIIHKGQDKRVVVVNSRGSAEKTKFPK